MRSLPSYRCTQGFSLVEILVGVTIALIGIAVMFQVLQDWEGRKRTTSSGSDAQVSGSIAIYRIERDVKIAGYGFGGAAEMGCTVSAYDQQRAGGDGADIPIFQMVPVLITNGAAGTADSLSVLYGNGTTSSAFRPYTRSTATSKIADDADGLKPGDLLIAAETASGKCALFETTLNAPGLQATTTHATGNYTPYQGDARAARYNDGTARALGTGAGNLYNLGTAPQLNIWTVDGGSKLQITNVIANEAASDVAAGVVNLQAQYGVDTDADGIVDQWIDPPAPADWHTVLAIRVALLARSQQYEKTSVTTVVPSWAAGSFVMTNLDGSAGTTSPNSVANWRRYRYRVYETLIPLRNVIWGVQP